MTDKRRKANSDNEQALTERKNRQLQAALAKAKLDIEEHIAAKQQAAYLLHVLRKDDLAGEVPTKTLKAGKEQQEVALAKQVKSLAEQYQQFVKQTGAKKQSHGRLKQLDMHPVLSNEYLHKRQHANHSLGSEGLYHAFMQDKQAINSSLNQALASYMFASALDEPATIKPESGNESRNSKASQASKIEEGKRYTVRLYMLSKHGEELASLLSLDKQSGDRVCSQATWTKLSAKKYRLQWKELSDPSLYSQYTELTCDTETDSLAIIRPGEFSLKLDFKLGTILQSNYHTPYGDIPMITQTEQLDCDLSRPEAGYVHLVYFLSNDNQNGHYVSIDLKYTMTLSPLTKEDLKRLH